MHTFSQKLLTGVVAAGMMISTGVVSVGAAQVGTGTVAGSGGLTTAVDWNGTFTNNAASGSINGLYVKARVKPVLNMVVSGSGIIDLGDLVDSDYSTGTVNVEIGTNAVNGASATARSTNGGLQNTSSPTTYINDLTTDEVADSYKFSSAIVAADDSSYAAFAQSATLNTEVDNNTTSHTLYTSSKPQVLSVGTDDFSFSVSAKPSIETPAGDYTDIVVLTVTGNF
ncbi:MAG: hypothetical protein HHAS10_06560 [Candidatus Altimarinota bacterium]